MEDPYIRKEYEETLRRNGVDSRMDPAWFNKPADVEWPPRSRAVAAE
jgi:hypothetical protein